MDKAELEKELQDKTNEYSKVCMEMGHEIALRANLFESIEDKELKAIELNKQCAAVKADLDKLAAVVAAPAV